MAITPINSGSSIGGSSPIETTDGIAPDSTIDAEAPAVGNDSRMSELIAWEKPQTAPPLQMAEIEGKIKSLDQQLQSLPEWTEQSMKLFGMKFPASPFEKQEVHVPTLAEMKDHPMVQLFDANSRAAAGNLTTAKELMNAAKAKLADGDPAGARQLYDSALGFTKAANSHVKRNGDWLKIRQDKVVDAMDKHATDLMELGWTLASSAGADAYLAGKMLGLAGKAYHALRELKMASRGSESAAKSLSECEKIARMDINEAKTFLNCNDDRAIKELAGARSKVLDTYLSDAEKLKKADPALLEKCSFQTSAGAHLTAAEVSLMQKNLAIVGKIDKQFLEAQGVTREILTELEKNPGAAANKLREVLQNPGKLLTIEPKQLLRIAADAGVDLTAADAKLLITGADPKLMRMTLVSAAERLEVGYKAPEAAKALRSFLEETRGHVRAVQDSAKIMEKRLPQWKALTEEQLVKEYGMSEKEATALKKEFDSLSPQDFKPAYHDVLGPGSKMKGDVGTFMARPGKPMDEPTIAWAIDRHNATNLHHRPNTPGSRMEGAIDMIAAMRQERVYRPESLPWTGGKEGEDIRTIIFGGGPKRIGNQGMPLEKFKDMMPKRTPPDPAESAWKKLMFKEMQSVDDKMLVRPQDIFKSFVPG